MKKFSRKEIDKAVDVLNEALQKKNIGQRIYLILIGAASLIVRYNLKRATRDIDIMDIGLSINRIGGLGSLLSQLGYHVVSDAIVNLHPDYLERVEHITQKGNVSVLCLGPYDLSISKISRGLARDIDDIVLSDVLEDQSLDILEQLYAEASSYWIGNPEQYKLNWDLFKDAYQKHQTKIPD
ncbi:MAG: hypothetical protein KKD44_12645 [Proteobacteria bacterium]|nr:hypothetical protein [Pseudomonadota bacterium]